MKYHTIRDTALDDKTETRARKRYLFKHIRPQLELWQIFYLKICNNLSYESHIVLYCVQMREQTSSSQTILLGHYAEYHFRFVVFIRSRML